MCIVEFIYVFFKIYLNNNYNYYYGLTFDWSQAYASRLYANSTWRTLGLYTNYWLNYFSLNLFIYFFINNPKKKR